MIKPFLFTTLCLFLLSYSLFAQRPKSYSASDIEMKLEKLDVLGTALYIAAHPDDENTRLITYLSKDKKVYTAYMSLTRGDGGQNSIGPEIREELGMIRTQELLAARRVDGGKQFFARAIDFGYSKTSEETFTKWDRNELLADVVWVIRNFRPDVMINRFPPDSRAGHGHHQVSAILSAEAFQKAGDPKAFPEQLKYVDVWQPKRLFLNTGRWWNPDMNDDSDSVVSVDIGAYNPVLGKSYSEIAAESRSQHKSQSFGVSSTRGVQPEYLELIDGPLAQEDPFDGVNLSWSRLGKKYSHISDMIAAIKSSYNFRDPAAIVPQLIELRKEIAQIKDDFWKKRKLHEVDELIQACMGLYVEAVTHQKTIVPGDSMLLDIEMINRSGVPAKVLRVVSGSLEAEKNIEVELNQNIEHQIDWALVLPENTPYTIPYWLDKPSDGELYNVSDLMDRGKAEKKAPLTVDFKMLISGEEITLNLPVVYKWNDHIKGEQYEPLEIVPPVYVELSGKSYVFANGGDKQVSVTVTAAKSNVEGTLQLKHPKGWTSSPESVPFQLLEKGTEKTFVFTLHPPALASDAELEAIAEINGKAYNRGVYAVDYPHIPVKYTYPFAKARIVKVELNKGAHTHIGYIEGAGDDVAESLSEVGYEVTILDESNLGSTSLDKFDAIVVGIMAFNNLPYLQQYNKVLLQYAENGGTLVIQYNNVRIGMKADIPMPYPIQFTRQTAQCRVSVEDAPVKILDQSHPVMQKPNKIKSQDFDGWVQERGLYFPIKWDDHYEAILSSHDPGEEPLNGGLLVTKYGKGYYVYTAYSWFRQLPVGVPGAYRIMSNIISLQQ